jgi:multiple sugar transport system substrate-binding protein
MTPMTRRQLLALAGALAGSTALSGCDTAPGAASSGSGTAGAGGSIRWWDQFKPTSEVEKQIFADFAKTEGGLPVEYNVYNPQKMGEALQLAYSSKQMPDVFTLVGVGLPPAALVDQSWFSPLQLDEETKSSLPAGSLLDGITVFDGQTYSFPWASFRHHDSLTWFNRESFEGAGLDPDAPPKTYDEFRSAAAAMQKAGMAGWIAPLALLARVGTQISQLAEAAGSPTSENIDITTGEYAFHNDYMLAALEWWKAMQKDGLLFPGSGNLDARNARARWAAGGAGMFLDGQYCIGVVVQDFAQFADKVAVGPIPLPDKSTTAALNFQPAGGTFWVSAGSQHVEAASALIGRFATMEAQVALTGGMNSVPLYPEALEKADVHPTFRSAADMMTSSIYLAPSPVVRNTDVSRVYAAMKPVHPNLGEIVSGVMTGDVPDARKALTELSGKMESEREKAIQTVNAEGGSVSVDDWAFSDWSRGADYQQTT